MANLAQGNLSNAPGAAGTTFILTSATNASHFTDSDEHNSYAGIRQDSTEAPTVSNTEFVKIVSINNTEITVERAVNSSTALNLLAGAYLYEADIAVTFDELRASIANAHAQADYDVNNHQSKSFIRNKPSGADIRDKLTTLDDDDRLPASAIKDLPEADSDGVVTGGSVSGTVLTLERSTGDDVEIDGLPEPSGDLSNVDIRVTWQSGVVEIDPIDLVASDFTESGDRTIVTGGNEDFGRWAFWIPDSAPTPTIVVIGSGYSPVAILEAPISLTIDGISGRYWRVHSLLRPGNAHNSEVLLVWSGGLVTQSRGLPGSDGDDGVRGSATGAGFRRSSATLSAIPSSGSATDGVLTVYPTNIFGSIPAGTNPLWVYFYSIAADDTITWQRPVRVSGIDGTPGTSGDDGQGVLVGGTTGQIYAKASDVDYDTEWIDAPTGGGGTPTPTTTNFFYALIGEITDENISTTIPRNMLTIPATNIITNRGDFVVEGGTSSRQRIKVAEAGLYSLAVGLWWQQNANSNRNTIAGQFWIQRGAAIIPHSDVRFTKYSRGIPDEANSGVLLAELTLDLAVDDVVEFRLSEHKARTDTFTFGGQSSFIQIVGR